MRQRQGSIWYEKRKDPKTGKVKVIGVYARVTFVDEQGRRRDRRRKAQSGTRTEAREHIKDLLKELEGQGERAIDGARMTFSDLAEYYKAEYCIPAEYNEKGEKIIGMRSYKDMRRKVDYAKAYFGQKRIKDITYADLSRYRKHMIRTPVKTERKHKVEEDGKKIIKRETTETPRSISSVHRQLATVRRMLSVAVQEQWLVRSPFELGDALIDPALEVPRERIATKAEEKALMAQCAEPRQHLGDFLVCMFDTGMRPGEVFRLERKDVDLEAGELMAVSYKGKRRRERPVRMTSRLKAVCERLCKGLKPSDRLFKVNSVKRSFATAKRLAGLEGISLDGFRLHDIRHTTTTRLIKKHMPLSEASKLLGHTQPSTTWRYNNPADESRAQAADILEAYEDD